MEIVSGFPPSFRYAALVRAHMEHAARNSACLDHRDSAAVVSLDAYQISPVVAACNTTVCATQCQRFSGLPCPAVPAEINACEALQGLGLPPADLRGLTMVSSAYPGLPGLAAIESLGISTVIVLDKTPANGLSHMSQAMEGVRNYHHRMGYPQLNGDDETRYRQAREILLALHMEIAELTNSIQWKPWRRARCYTRHNMMEECADVLFFIDSLAMLYGVSWDDLTGALHEKLHITDNRLKGGYYS